MKDQIIEILRNSEEINFQDFYTDNYDALEELLRHELPKNAKVSFDSGISKVVILIAGENYVLKIPFVKMFDEDSYNSDVAYWDSGEWEGEEEYSEPNIENYFSNFEWAESDKVSTSNNWDYCALECAFYEIATERGLEQYFAKEELYAVVLDHPVYIQERVTPLEASEKSISYEQAETTRKRCSDLSVRCFNPKWVTDFFNCYGEQEFIKLSNFLEEMKIYDLHEGNLGYLYGAPVLLDYSDFREW